MVGCPGRDVSSKGIFYVATGGIIVMRRWVYILLALVILSVCFVGCAGGSKEIKTRCPKCAGYFNTREGEEAFRSMHGR